eukprot:2482748-Rhodomonas_salina.1
MKRSVLSAVVVFSSIVCLSTSDRVAPFPHIRSQAQTTTLWSSHHAIPSRSLPREYRFVRSGAVETDHGGIVHENPILLRGGGDDECPGQDVADVAARVPMPQEHHPRGGAYGAPSRRSRPRHYTKHSRLYTLVVEPISKPNASLSDTLIESVPQEDNVHSLKFLMSLEDKYTAMPRDAELAASIAEFNQRLQKDREESAADGRRRYLHRQHQQYQQH